MVLHHRATVNAVQVAGHVQRCEHLGSAQQILGLHVELLGVQLARQYHLSVLDFIVGLAQV